MKVHVDEILTKKGKTRNWLADQTGIAYKTMCKICKNEASSVSFEYIDRICTVLECGIEEIFEVEEKRYNKNLAEAKNLLDTLSEDELISLISQQSSRIKNSDVISLFSGIGGLSSVIAPKDSTTGTSDDSINSAKAAMRKKK